MIDKAINLHYDYRNQSNTSNRLRNAFDHSAFITPYRRSRHAWKHSHTRVNLGRIPRLAPPPVGLSSSSLLSCLPFSCACFCFCSCSCSWYSCYSSLTEARCTVAAATQGPACSRNPSRCDRNAVVALCPFTCLL